MFFNINYKAQNIGIRNLNLMVVLLPLKTALFQPSHSISFMQMSHKGPKIHFNPKPSSGIAQAIKIDSRAF